MVYCIMGCGVASTRSPSAFSIQAGASGMTLPSGCRISMLSPAVNLPRSIALTDAIERLLYPLAKLHVPVHTFAMMMTIALRFIPTIVDETDKIMSAQKARGADFTTGSLASRAKALIPVIVPLFASAFRRADELATAMECRCYHGGEGRTRLRVLRCHARDFVLLAAVAVLIAGVVIINIEGARHGWLYTMQIGWFV